MTKVAGFATGTACPECNSLRSAVRDKRNTDGIIWRNRVCDNGHKYRTVESIESKDAAEKRQAAAKEREIAAQFQKNNSLSRKYPKTQELPPKEPELPPKDQDLINRLLAKSDFKKLSEVFYDL